MFEVRTKAEASRIPNVPEGGPHVFFGDVFANKDPKVPNPLVGSWFRIEEGPTATPPPYTYDEVGVVVEGDITLEDETGNKKKLVAGDTFVIYRGSTVAFSSSHYGLAWKCGNRPKL